MCTRTHTHTNVHVYVCCIYKHEQKNVTSGRASERSSEFSVFSVFVLLLQHCLTHSSTYTCTCERKYVCMYHARVFMLYNSSSPPPPATFLIGLINSDPAAGAAVNISSMWETVILHMWEAIGLANVNRSNASAVMHKCTTCVLT